MLAAIERSLTAIPGKTYVGVIGFLAGALYNVLVTKDYNMALVLVSSALGALGIRTAFVKQTEDVKKFTSEVANQQTNLIRLDTKDTVNAALVPSKPDGKVNPF